MTDGFTFDLRLETIVDGILKEANNKSVEIIVEPLFDDEVYRSLSAVINNVKTNNLGIISVNVKEYLDEPVCFFIIHRKMHEYCRMEGFTIKDMLYNDNLKGKIFEKVDLKKFVKFLIHN